MQPAMSVWEILTMAAPPRYINGGEAQDDGSDRVGDNPTGRARKSSARARRKKLRRLFKGSQWDPDKST